jgi:hypothetical protein
MMPELMSSERLAEWAAPTSEPFIRIFTTRISYRVLLDQRPTLDGFKALRSQQ